MSKEGIADYLEVIDDLHQTWIPHDGQIRVGKKLFNDDIRKIFIQCGRKWGKTEIIMYFLFRWAITNPGSNCYYMSPYQKQSKELIWANKRLQNFLEKSVFKKYIKSLNGTELRITLYNESFIKLDGSDNFDAYRGIEPHIIVYEEFKDFRPEFHDAMDPNLVVYNAPLIIIGTPPSSDCQYTQIAEEFKEDPEAYHIEAPTFENPHISRDWLAKKKAQLIARGDWDQWEREYMGRYIKGGAAKIFPMLTEKIIVPHGDMVREIAKDLKRMKKIIVCDPAGASVFGVLFMLINPYNKKIYIIDQIYEKNQKEMSVVKLGERILKKRDEIYDRGDDWDWDYVYDEASTWFYNEFLDHFSITFIASQKSKNKKENGISLIKDILNHDLMRVSDRCVQKDRGFFWELDNYIKDDKGKIPKINDHLIDAYRYGLGHEMYDLINLAPPVEPEMTENWRGARISDDFPNRDDFGNIDKDDLNQFW